MQDKFMSCVKVGAKGQIVIPKEVREMFGIEPGDNLILLADKDRGIAITAFDEIKDAIDSAFNNNRQNYNREFIDEVNRVKEKAKNE